ncbi:MAG TPA: hypothetical protein P5284_08345 [Candidatus Contendobacter sp.]|nr:hypothetical protein [Verrucomicrobiota bacterium]HRZ23982.1 hypothetical protein [Candidatus Contendobacter sp.]HRZ53163.1 hypothetical protein [Candidatus Contendobacter sp.]
MPRIADSELAANVRQRNRVNSERRRQRLAIAGKVQLLTWIPDTLRRELDSVAAARREPVSETAAVALAAGLAQIPTTPVSAYHCLRCGSRMTVAREREPLCDACEAASQPATTTTPDAPPPVYTGVVSSRDALMTEVGKLLDEGLSGAEVARRLNASGQRTANGAEFTSANLLRDFRRWQMRDRQDDDG